MAQRPVRARESLSRPRAILHRRGAHPRAGVVAVCSRFTPGTFAWRVPKASWPSHNPVGFTSYRFDSILPHQPSLNVRLASFLS
jgi:hypothetical protein